MKMLKMVFLAVALLAFTSVAMADTIDPAVGVQGGSGTVGFPGTITFAINSTTSSCFGGICDFTSQIFSSNVDITSFGFSFDQSQFTGFSVAPGSIFQILTIVNDVGTANPLAILSGGTICGTSNEFCPEGSFIEFALVMNGVVQGTNVTVEANPAPVPEPASVLLLSAGLGFLGLLRRRRNKALD